MARGINKVIIVGNLGDDPDVRHMPNGNAVTRVSVATSESWKDKQTGQSNERTEWHRVVFFNRLGEIAGEYLKKGSKVYVEGQLRTNQWEKDGQKHYTTEIIAREMQMLDGRAEGQQGQSNSRQNQSNQSNQSNQGNSNSSSSFQDGPPADFDDDIPF